MHPKNIEIPGTCWDYAKMTCLTWKIPLPKVMNRFERVVRCGESWACLRVSCFIICYLHHVAAFIHQIPHFGESQYHHHPCFILFYGICLWVILLQLPSRYHQPFAPDLRHGRQRNRADTGRRRSTQLLRREPVFRGFHAGSPTAGLCHGKSQKWIKMDDNDGVTPMI